MKKIFKNILIIIICLVILIWIVFYIKNNWADFKSIRIISGPDFVALFLIIPVYYFSQAIMLKLILEPFKIKLKFKEWFGLTMITMMGNFIVPFSGLGFRAVYLKKAYGFQIKHFVSTLSAIWIVNFLIFTLGGLISLLILWYKIKLFSIVLTVSLSLVFMLCLLGWIVPLPKFQTKYQFINKISSILESWHQVKTNRHLMKALIYWSIIEFFLFVLVFWFAFRTFGFNLGFIGAFLPAALADFSYFLRLLPASLGIYEGTVIYTAKVLGFSIPQALTVTVLTRVVTFIWIFALGGYYSVLLSRKK